MTFGNTDYNYLGFISKKAYKHYSGNHKVHIFQKSSYFHENCRFSCEKSYFSWINFYFSQNVSRVFAPMSTFKSLEGFMECVKTKSLKNAV